jgi:hypothetical protein
MIFFNELDMLDYGGNLNGSMLDYARSVGSR